MSTKGRLLKPVFACLLLAGVLAAAPAKKNIVISLERKEIRDMDPSGLILAFVLEIANSSRSTYSLIEYDYRVVVEGTDYFALRTGLDAPIPVENDKSTRISLPIKVTYVDLMDRVPVVADIPKASCYVTGLMIFADSRGRQEKIPFAFSGDFPVFKKLEVEVKPLDLRTLTIGGAVFTLSFTIRNGNSFELMLEKLAYKLEAEGRTISEGLIPGARKIESQGEASFSQPLMLDFFEVGREVFDILQKPSVPFLFNGGFQFDSVWGEFKVDFAEKGDLPIVRAQ